MNITPEEFVNRINKSLVVSESTIQASNPTKTAWGFFYQFGDCWMAVVESFNGYVEYQDVDPDNFNPLYGEDGVHVTSLEELIETLVEETVQ